MVGPLFALALLAGPWQQNVYTNRFTVMCETAGPCEGLELQYGERYESVQPMTGVTRRLDGTFIYRARVAVDGRPGATIPYRLGCGGKPLDGAAAGAVMLWQDGDRPFTCAVWGDNQHGAQSGDWDADPFRCATAMLDHMLARKIDFGITTGDVSTHGDYDRELRPLVLERTHAILGRTLPTYVAWGNHDAGFDGGDPMTMRYFESGVVDDPSSSGAFAADDGSGAYCLYRNNVLLVFVHWKSVHDLGKSAYGPNDESVRTWLASVLATDRAKRAKFRLLFVHVPMWVEAWAGHSSTFLLDVAKAGGVDVVFSGHAHTYERIERDGIVQVTNGGAGALEHYQCVEREHLGSATKVGGHHDVPYLWSRQDLSSGEPGVLGALEPVRMGCLASYGELSVAGDTLTYLAHGFNADGSYLGVFDSFALKSKASRAAKVIPFPPEALTSPVDNATWAAYKAARGEPFEYPAGADRSPVVNVSKREIESFAACLGGDWRLPTVGELRDLFAGDYRREVTEWTDSIDPSTGWCRLLGGNSKTASGFWCRAVDNPLIASADCHADYLGFRLVRGPRPPDPPDPWAAPLAALREIAAPSAVYKWDRGALVDISREWADGTAATYDVPVVFTGSGAICLTNSNALAFNAGLASPHSASLAFVGNPSLCVRGALAGGKVTDKWGWTLQSGGTLTLADVSAVSQGISLKSADRTLRLAGTNVLDGTTLALGAPGGVIRFAAAQADLANPCRTVLRMRNMVNYAARRVDIDEGVGVELSEDYRVHFIGAALWIDGTLDARGVCAMKSIDAWFMGSGTLATGYFSQHDRSCLHLGVSNIVLGTSAPWRSSCAGEDNRYLIEGEDVRITSLEPWTLGAFDAFHRPCRFLSGTTVDEPSLTFAGPARIDFAPSECDAILQINP